MKKFFVALFAALFLTLPAPTPAIELKDIGNQTMLVEGPIQSGDFKKFAEFYNASLPTGRPYRHVILKDSTGGDFAEAVEMGLNIHEFELSTETWGYCYSACAYIWLAGTTRYGHPSDVILIHAPAVKEKGPEAALQNEYGAASASWYLGRIGLNAAAPILFVVDTKQPDYIEINLDILEKLEIDITLLKDGVRGR